MYISKAEMDTAAIICFTNCSFKNKKQVTRCSRQGLIDQANWLVSRMQATPLKSMQFLVQKAEQHQAICVKFQASLWVNKYGVFARQVKGLLIFLGAGVETSYEKS